MSIRSPIRRQPKPASRLIRWSCALAALVPGVAFAADAAVTIDRVNAADVPVSKYNTGVTFTQTTFPWNADATAKGRGRAILAETSRFYNVHIFGWGTTNPMANVPNDGIVTEAGIDFTSLDKRMREIRDVPLPAADKQIVITFCGCPDWMQKEIDWDENKEPDPGYTNENDGLSDPDNTKKAPHDSNFGRYADLCAFIAKRYDGTTDDPLDSSKKLPKVEYFQVWNEMNGFWDTPNDKQDMPRYLNLYNAIWDKVKHASFRPDAKIGGPYITVECTGSNRNWSLNPDATTNTGQTPATYDRATSNYWPDDTPLIANGKHKQREVLAYFMQQTKTNRTPDFFCFDRGVIYYNQLRDQQCYTNDQVMDYTPQFSAIVNTLHQMMEDSNHYGTRIPIWVSEYYGSRYTVGHKWWRPEDMSNGQPTTPTPYFQESVSDDYQNALYASMYNHMVRSGVAVGLLWGPEEGNPNIPHHLWTNTTSSGGGQPMVKHRDLLKTIHLHFSDGMPLYTTSSSLSGVEMLAGGRKIMLINKTATNKTVQINDAQNQVDYYKTHSTPITLTGHQVKVFDSLPYVKNGSMSADAGGVPADWNLSWVDNSKPGTVVVARVDNQYANPDKCEPAGQSTHHSLNIKSGNGLTIKAMRGQRISCYPDPDNGSSYVVTGMLRYSGTGSTTKRVFMKMFDKDMNEISGTWTSLHVGNANNQWEMFNTTINVPANARFLEIWLDYEGTGQIWLDAVRIVTTATP